MSKAPPSARRDRIAPFVPKLVELTGSMLYGDIWERPGLSKRDRSLITIAALIALNRQDQLAAHVERGLGNGVTKAELGEIITHLALYAGWPTGMSAAHTALDVLERKA